MDNDCCPHCGKNFPEDYAAELCPTEGRDWECAGCGKEYNVRIQPRIEVRTYQNESDTSE